MCTNSALYQSITLNFREIIDWPKIAGFRLLSLTHPPSSSNHWLHRGVFSPQLCTGGDALSKLQWCHGKVQFFFPLSYKARWKKRCIISIKFCFPALCLDCRLLCIVLSKVHPTEEPEAHSPKNLQRSVLWLYTVLRVMCYVLCVMCVLCYDCRLALSDWYPPSPLVSQCNQSNIIVVVTIIVFMKSLSLRHYWYWWPSHYIVWKLRPEGLRACGSQ